MSGFIASYQTATAATPSKQERLERWSDGASAANTTLGQRERLVPNGTSVIAIAAAGGDVTQYDATLTQEWSWTPPTNNGTSWDAAPLADGTTLLSFENNDSGNTEIYHVDGTGTGTLIGSVALDLLGSYCPGVSIELSTDESTVFMLLDEEGNDKLHIVGVSVSAGTTLWNFELLAVTGVDYRRKYSAVRAAPGTDTLFACGIVPGASWPHMTTAVMRLDFASGVTSAPAITWTKHLSDPDAEEYLVMNGMAVNGDIVCVGHQPLSTGAIVTAYAHDGTLQWQFSGAAYYDDGTFTSPNGLALSGAHALVGTLSNQTEFPTEECGLILLDASTGASVTLGTFPLETYWQYGVASSGSDVAPPPPTATAQDRIASSVQENAGSILQATQAIAIDANINESFPWGTDAETGDYLSFREAFTPDDQAFAYYATRTRNLDLRVSVTGETIMSRLARTIPPSIMIKASDLTGAPDSVTAQEAVQYILDQWESTYDWFFAEHVPDLRLLVAGAVGDEQGYYVNDDPDAGKISIEAIFIPQEFDPAGTTDDRQTMRDIIDEWLGIFPGTIVRANASGKIELIPRVGPDVPDVAHELEWDDIVNMSEGEDDPSGIANRARVISQGYEFTEDQDLMPAKYAVYWHPDGLPGSILDDGGVLPTAESMLPSEVVVYDGLVKSGESVSVSITVTAYGARSKSSSATLTQLGTNSDTLTLAAGASQQVGVAFFTGPAGWPAVFTVEVRNTGTALQVVSVGGVPASGPSILGTNYLAYLVQLTSVTGTAWARAGKRIIGSFGYESADTLPGPDDTDALATSVDTFGEREATITSSQFQLTEGQAQDIARAHVLSRINPKTIRQIQQSLWNKYLVKFDDIGKRVTLPNDETGIVESREYADSSSLNSFAIGSAITVAVTTSALDTETTWLYLDDGDYMQLDDGSTAEEQ